MKSLDCLTLTIVVIGGLSVATVSSAWAGDTKKSAPAPARAAPPLQVHPQPQPHPQPMRAAPPPARPAQVSRPNLAVTHQAAGNAAKAAHPSPAVHQEHPRQAGGAAHQAETPRPVEHGAGMAAGHGPAAAPGGQHPGMPAAQARFDEHVRDPGREHETARVHEHDFHTRDVRRFDVQEREHWRTGRWHNDWHYGRFGWWYQVDDVWYAYPAPIFPYPLIVAPIVVEDAVGPVPDAPPPAAAAIGLAPLPPLPKAAYHCGNPEGFFPVVEECSVEWIAVNAH
jgi:hypothetical protein